MSVESYLMRKRQKYRQQEVLKAVIDELDTMPFHDRIEILELMKAMAEESLESIPEYKNYRNEDGQG